MFFWLQAMKADPVRANKIRTLMAGHSETVYVIKGRVGQTRQQRIELGQL